MADSKLREALKSLLPHARAYIEQAIKEGSMGEAEKQALWRVQAAEAALAASGNAGAAPRVTAEMLRNAEDEALLSAGAESTPESVDEHVAQILNRQLAAPAPTGAVDQPSDYCDQGLPKASKFCELDTSTEGMPAGGTHDAHWLNIAELMVAKYWPLEYRLKEKRQDLIHEIADALAAQPATERALHAMLTEAIGRLRDFLSEQTKIEREERPFLICTQEFIGLAEAALKGAAQPEGTK